MHLQTNWHNVPATLYRGNISFATPVDPSVDTYLQRVPVYLRNVSISYNTIEIYQYGNPQDWITRIPKGGTISCSGIMVPTDSSLKWITAKFWERVVIGNFGGFEACRILNQTLTAEPIAGGLSVLHGSYTFSFERRIP